MEKQVPLGKTVNGLEADYPLSTPSSGKNELDIPKCVEYGALAGTIVPQPKLEIARLDPEIGQTFEVIDVYFRDHDFSFSLELDPPPSSPYRPR